MAWEDGVFSLILPFLLIELILGGILMIITIGREFGSGGRDLGRRLSEELGIAYYDSEILTEIAKRTSLSENYIKEIIEKKPYTSFPIHIGRSLHPMSSPIQEQTNIIYQEQSETIKDLAKKSDCVIVGRCADYILRDEKPFRIFVYADMAHKIERCKQRAPEDEHLTEKGLVNKIKSIDKNRKKYYDFYTGNDWGDRKNYDLLVNTSTLSVKQYAKSIAEMLKSL